MGTQSNSRRTMLIVFLAIIFCTAVMSFVCAQKDQYHVDEIWTFALSNSYEKPVFYTWKPGLNGDETPESAADFDVKEQESYKAYFYHWNDGTFYHNYLTVQPDQRFEYGNTYHNQETDTHPPLYYFIIHTICSFFPDRFSKWFGMIPNLMFYALSMLMLFLISKELQKNDIHSVMTMMLWGLSRAGIYAVIYIRMYMMLAFLTLCLTYLHILLLKNFRRKYVVLIVIVDILAFLTQYYYYIYAFFITAFTCLILLYRKNFRQMFGFGFSVLGAVGISIAAFPAAIRHVTHGTWTEETVENAAGSRNAVSEMLKYSFDHYSEIIKIIVLLTLIICMVYVIKQLHSEEGSYGKTAPVEQLAEIKKKSADIFRPLYDYLCKGNALILVSVICSGVLICKLSPDMGLYGDRYVIWILPLLAVFFTDVTVLFADKAAGIFSKKPSSKIVYGIAGILMLICAACGNLSSNNIYLVNNAMTESDPDLAELVADRAVILVNGKDDEHIHAYSYAFSKADMVCAADAVGDDLAEVINDYEGSEPLLLIVDGEAEGSNEINDFLQSKTGCGFQYVTRTHYTLANVSNLYIYELTPQYQE